MGGEVGEFINWDLCLEQRGIGIVELVHPVGDGLGFKHKS